MAELAKLLQSMEYVSNDLVRNAVDEGDEEKRAVIRKRIYAVEEEIHHLIDSETLEEEEGTLTHYFSTGVYARELLIPADTIMTSKLHKLPRLCIISKGDVTFTTETGTRRIKAPYTAVFPPGSKVALYTHEDTVWTAIHGTDETDLDKLESDLIAKDHAEYFEFKKSLLLGKQEIHQ
ncbi:MAG: hypothetical protein E4H40_04365 [Candidatus Brocadiia bacterium]|nr:MAG: hypothetical protein E4H40_04365 [Candidatus Brocadiia bacterium]